MQRDRQQMRRLKDALFENLKTPADDTDADSIAREIGRLQTAIDQNTYQHFKAVRAMLKPAQQKKFDDVIQSVLRNMGGPPPRREGPGGRGFPPDGPPPHGEHPEGPPPGEHREGPPHDPNN
jgi:hypothetical protein